MDFCFYTVEITRESWEKDALWNVKQHASLEAAIQQYRRISPLKERTLGIVELRESSPPISRDVEQRLDLVRCLCIYPEEECGEDILVTDYRMIQRWKDNPQVQETVKRLRAELSIDKMLYFDLVVSIPENERPNSFFVDKQLLYPDPLQSVDAAYIIGQGWLSASAYEQQIRYAGIGTRYIPFVEKYRVRYITRDGKTGMAEASLQDFAYLYEQSKQACERKWAAQSNRKQSCSPER